MTWVSVFIKVPFNYSKGHYMKLSVLATLFVLTLTQAYAGLKNHPRSPDPSLTPGSLCDRPTSYRYKEQIPYCERDVNGFTKELIFSNYRRYLGYSLSSDRADYKVDHFIPLCAGGSNNEDNLWPQHVSISQITDPIESTGCEKLSQGRITQKELVALVMKAKLNTDEAPRVLKTLRSLR